MNARGILVVASAGNDGIDTDTEAHIPSSLPVSNIISVAAIDIPAQLSTLSLAVPQLSLWSGSNYGTHTVHIAAPGVQAWHSSQRTHHMSHDMPRSLRHMPRVAMCTQLVVTEVGTVQRQSLRPSCRPGRCIPPWHLS